MITDIICAYMTQLYVLRTILYHFILCSTLYHSVLRTILYHSMLHTILYHSLSLCVTYHSVTLLCIILYHSVLNVGPEICATKAVTDLAKAYQYGMKGKILDSDNVQSSLPCILNIMQKQFLIVFFIHHSFLRSNLMRTNT